MTIALARPSPWRTPFVLRTYFACGTVYRPGTGFLVPVALTLLAVVNCTTGDRRSPRWPEESPPRFSVSLAESAAAVIVLDSVRLVAAPPIEFAAIIELDREHTTPILAMIEGESHTLALAPATSVRRGDTLARLRRARPGDPWAVVAPIAGWWRPRRYVGEAVWSGDTLGSIQSDGWYRAIGRVDHSGRSPVRPGDPATVVIPRLHTNAVGAVASIGAAEFGGIDVSIHFQARPDTVLPAMIVQITVLPRESVLVAPSAGLASLSSGTAVFIPEGNGAFSVRFLIVDPHDSLGRIVHAGLDAPGPVAAEGLGLLQAAAEESLSAYGGRHR